LDAIRPALIFAGRTGLGVTLAIVFSMVGIGLAWGAFVFSGAISWEVWFSLAVCGAGIGAGLGGFLAWLRIDGDSRSFILVTISVAVLAGVGGAWGGYQYGANQEVACCARPDIGPLTHTAFGATVAANGVALLLGIVRGVGARRW